jgi:nicotinamidase/pyrazinamidase
MNALIIIDVQNDFVPGGRLAVPGGHEIIPLINQLQNSFSLVVATQDWHPVEHKSFASNHPGKNVFEKIDLNALSQVLWPDHCIQASVGAEIHGDLDTERVEAIFRKVMNPEIDSYSGFFDNGYRKATGLAGYLREHKVKKVFTCGLAADYCVFYTSMDAIKEGFETYLIEDATRAIDSSGFDIVKMEVGLKGGKVINSSDLKNYL